MQFHTRYRNVDPAKVRDARGGKSGSKFCFVNPARERHRKAGKLLLNLTGVVQNPPLLPPFSKGGIHTRGVHWRSHAESAVGPSNATAEISGPAFRYSLFFSERFPPSPC